MKKGKAKKKSNKKKIIQKKNIKRKTNSKCKPSKMSLRQKEFMAITILAVFVFAFLLASMNTPSQNTSITGHQIAGLEKVDMSGIGIFFQNIIDPVKADEAVIKWVLFFTFAIGLWGIISLFFERGRGGLIKFLSLPFAFAMVYFLKLDEIFSGLIGYSAMGMTVITIVPFVAIIFFSVRLLEGKVNAAKIITQILVWIFYLVFLIYFLVRAAFFSPGIKYNVVVIIFMVIGIIASIIIIWKNEHWRNFIAKLGREGIGKEIRDVQHALGVEKEEERYRGEMWRNPSRKR